jgi:hypothetical protein
MKEGRVFPAAPIGRLRQWKIALSLAVVGAAASPFALGTYKMRPPVVQRWVSLAEEDNKEFAADLVARLKRTNDCLAIDDQWDVSDCYLGKKFLEDGGFYGPRPSMLLYLAINAAAAILVFGTIFGLTFLLPALLRRYWGWLNT